MRTIIIGFFIFWLSLQYSFAAVCCQKICVDVGGGTTEYVLQDKCEDSPPCYYREVDMIKCNNQIPTSSSNEQFTPGKVTVQWIEKLISVCPPGIFGTGPCSYPSLIDLITRINELLRTVAPLLLVILLIIGGLMYLLSPLGVENYIQRGHKYIKYAVIGYIILLLVTLIFTIISALFGGPLP